MLSSKSFSQGDFVVGRRSSERPGRRTRVSMRMLIRQRATLIGGFQISQNGRARATSEYDPRGMKWADVVSRPDCVIVCRNVARVRTV